MTNYTVDIRSFQRRNRPLGITGIVRVRNEEEYLERIVEQCLPGLDECILCYGLCNDRTPEIAHSLGKRYPDKIKVYPYEEYSLPIASIDHSTNKNDLHSVSNHSNYALSKATYRYGVYIDGDDYMITEKFVTACDFIRTEMLTDYYVKFGGINLYDKNGTIYTTHDMHTGNHYCGRTDRGFFRIDHETYFTRNKTYEEFVHNNLQNTMCLSTALYFHVKHLKKRRGMIEYDYKPHNIAHGPFKWLERVLDPNLQTWLNYSIQYDEWTKGVPDPNAYGIPLQQRTTEDVEYLHDMMKVIHPKGAILGRDIGALGGNRTPI